MIDSTSFRVFFQQHRGIIIPLVSGIVIFMAGWQVGRVMSPYYAATPIVFQDRPCNDCSSSGGTDTELKALQDQGDAMAATVAPSVGAAPKATVAAAKTQAATAPIAAQGNFVASKNSNLYHYLTCPSAKRIKPENQRWFATVEAAKAAGLSPSKCSLDMGYK